MLCKIALPMNDESEPPPPNLDTSNDDMAIKDTASKMTLEEQDDLGVAGPSSKKRRTTPVDSEDGADDDKEASAVPESDARNWRRVMANRRSARESRERRKQRLEYLEKALEALSREHAEVVRENRLLRQQISSLLPHVDMASYQLQQNNDLSMIAAAGGMASAPSQFAPMGGIGGPGPGVGFPLPLPEALRLNGMLQLPSNHLNHQSLAMSQRNLGSATYYDQEQLANLQALQKSQGMHGPRFPPRK